MRCDCRRGCRGLATPDRRGRIDRTPEPSSFPSMNDDTTVIYNGSCPVCSREIGVYRGRAQAAGAPLRFVDLCEADLDAWGLSPEDAARRLHAIDDGRLISGVDAFVALWRGTPGFGWLARAVSLPIVRPVAGAVYEGVLAPLLFRMHLRRAARGRG